jgi:flavin-dependent dehydrogenase
LDRSNFPRNKPCGGGISIRVLERFPYLARELHRIATHTVSRLYLEGPEGESTIIESDEPAVLLIRRVEFDELLVSLAVEAGAELVSGAEIVKASSDTDRAVLVARDGRRFESPYVIAADGVHSVVAKRLGINPRWPARSIALDMMEETPRTALRDIDPSTLWVAYGFDPERGRDERQGGPTPPAKVHEGYAYIFPKRDHVNVGIGYVLEHYQASIGSPPYELQRGFVDHLKRVGAIEGDSVRRNFTPFLIPVGGPLARPGRGRVLLAGDAGGFVNGFTAEGIYYAMASGDLAARAILETPESSVARLVRNYRRACNYEIGAELRDSVLIQRYLFGDRRRIARAIQGSHRAPSLTRLVVDFAQGRLGYGALRRKLLLRTPLLAARLVWERLKAASRRGPAPLVARGSFANRAGLLR